MTRFKPYVPEQLLLLPPNMSEWLAEGHMAYFISDAVDSLDLTEIVDMYKHETERGQPAYHPAMMLKVLLYGYSYSVGVRSSRKIAKACWEDVAFRVLSANQHPDHRSIARYRKQHLKAFGRLFKQVLKLAQQAGLVKLGVVALDGTKMKANASKHKAMSYERMKETEKRLEKEIDEILRQAEEVDAEEDRLYGADNTMENPGAVIVLQIRCKPTGQEPGGSEKLTQSRACLPILEDSWKPEVTARASIHLRLSVFQKHSV